jgi:hypothetical protein
MRKIDEKMAKVRRLSKGLATKLSETASLSCQALRESHNSSSASDFLDDASCLQESFPTEVGEANYTER